MEEIQPLVVVLGPTATGKTRLAALLANRFHGEIISADSRQVYRRLDLGTGKDLSDYQVEGQIVPYHLIDIIDPGEPYNLFRFQRDFLASSGEIKIRGNLPILCGGTGLYIQAAIQGYHLVEVPEDNDLRKELGGKSIEELTSILSSFRKLHNTTDTHNPERAIRAIEIEHWHATHKEDQTPYPAFDPLLIGLNIDRNSRRRKITDRLSSRLAEGMVEEVQTLIQEGINPEELLLLGLEYKYLTLFVLGRISFEAMVTQLNTAIHQFAKRQMTWYRRMERQGYLIHWLDANGSWEEKLTRASRLIQQKWPGFGKDEGKN